MAWIMVFCIFPLLTSAEPDVDQITSKLLIARRIVHSENRSTILYHQPGLDPTVDDVLIRFLSTSMNPMFVTNRAETFNGMYQTLFYTILFVNRMDHRLQGAIDTNNRRIVVTSKSVMAAILNTSRYFSAVFVVYDDDQCPIYHYNRYTKCLNKLSDLQSDPLLDASKDLAGFSFALSVKDRIQMRFVNLVVSRLNGTYTSFAAGYTFSYIPIQLALHSIRWFLPVYLHQNEKLYALVPRLNQPVPAMFVITDPFDIPTWIAIFATILAFASLKTYLFQEHSVETFIDHIGSVLGTFTIGTEQTCTRELDRQLSGLTLLTSVVLVNAYQSMVISYLMSPRFYPELDTLSLLNDSCCWDRTEMVAWYNFQEKDYCSSSYEFDYQSLRNLKTISKIRDNRICTTVTQREKSELDRFPVLVLTSGLFRWSKQTINEVPMLAWIQGDAVITEIVSALSGAYFAEGALSNRIEVGFIPIGDPDHRDSLLKATSNDMLSIVWRIYAAGLALAVAVFCTEMVLKFCK